MLRIRSFIGLLHLHDDLNHIVGGVSAKLEGLVGFFQLELVSNQAAQIHLAAGDGPGSVHEVGGAEAEGANHLHFAVVDDVGVDGDGAAALQTTEDVDGAALATRGIFLFAFSYLFNGVNTFAATLFSALNNGKVSAVMAFLTTFVFLVAAIFGLPALGLGADGVWLAVPAAELLSLFVTVFLLRRNRSRYGF